QPFVRHEFLSALVECGCAAARSGWLPQILLLRRSGALVGAMPLFAKSHSYGEYVFDWAWADAHERGGVQYYPKLVSAVPFTPVRGRRILAAGAAERESLVAAALELARQTSSLHVLFPLEEEARLMHEHGMLLRHTVQFHWRNEGYRDFDDFLARLSHARRKNIRQERRRVGEAGVAVRWLEGAAIERRHWEFFNRCYRATYAAHRSSPYLNLQFFMRIGAKLPDHLAIVHVPLLHFECCYYQPIEYAIKRGIEVFEGGAQGEHKLFRGLMPVETLSAHWLAHPRFSRAVEAFLEREGAGVRRYVDELCDHSPFKA